MIRALAVFLALAGCERGHPRQRPLKIIIEYDAQAEKCSLIANGRVIASGPDWDERLRAFASGRAEDEFLIIGTQDAPYRCIGGAIFTLQRAGKDVAFIAEPAATAH